MCILLEIKINKREEGSCEGKKKVMPCRNYGSDLAGISALRVNKSQTKAKIKKAALYRSSSWLVLKLKGVKTESKRQNSV